MSTETHRFRLLLNSSRAVDDDELADALFEAGLGDLSFGVVAGVPFADAERAGDRLEHVVLATIRALEAVGDLRVVRVDPDELVTAARIAARTGRTRQSVGQLVSGERGPGGFPAPLTFIDAQTRVWRWPEVHAWFAEHYSAEVGAFDAATAQAAHFVAALNGALSLREQLGRYGTSGGDGGVVREILRLAGAGGPDERAAQGLDVASPRLTSYALAYLGSAPEADALTHLGRRVAARVHASRLGFAEVLTETLDAYDTSIVLHHHGRVEAARPYDRLVLGNGLTLIARYTFGRRTPPSELTGALLCGCDSAAVDVKSLRRHRVHAADQWRSRMEGWLRTTPVEATYRQWLRAIDAVGRVSDAPEVPATDSAYYSYYHALNEDDLTVRADEWAGATARRGDTPYLSFALAQTLASLAGSTLRPDERHLLEEISEHVNRALVEPRDR